MSLRVLMWNSCLSLVPASLVLPISASQHGRMVRELQTPTSASSCCCCCSWLCARSSSCTPRLSFCSDWSQFPSYCCSATNQQSHSLPPSCRSVWGRMDGFGRAEQVKQEDLADTDVRSDSEVPSSSSSSLSLSEDKTRATFPPAVKLRSKDQRPPWRYWRQTGAEPQHRQPGKKRSSRSKSCLIFN